VKTLLLLLVCSTAIAAQLPRLEYGSGLFYTPGRWADEPACMSAMAQSGLNTLATQARPVPGEPEGKQTAAQHTARQLNNAAAAGLLDSRFPVICYSVGPKDVVEAKKYRAPSAKWPELIVQSIDEPNHTQEATLRQYYGEAHKAGLRIGTALAGYVATGYTCIPPWCRPEDKGKWVPGMGQYLDAWVMLVGTFDPTMRAACEKQGALFGAYLAYPSSPILDRWTYGLWAWKVKPTILLAWAALNKQEGWDYSRIAEKPDGTIDPSGLKGIREGILDYRVLQAVRDLHSPRGDAFLRKVEAATVFEWWPRGFQEKNQHLEKPTVDLDNVRQTGLAILAEGGR